MEEKKKRNVKKKDQKKKQKKLTLGFTLVELLTTLVILSLIMGLGTFLVISLNNNSKDKASMATINSVKKSGVNYVLERDKTIGWITESEEVDEEYICVSVGSLVDYGYFNKEIFNNENLDRTDFVRVTRNKTTKSVVAEEFGDDVNSSCAQIVAYYPTCKDITYNGSKQELLNSYDNLKMTLINTDTKKTNAGDYEYNFSLKGDGKFTWEDGTIKNYKLTCSINKYTCSVSLANKEIRYDGNEHRYNVSEVTIKGVGNTVLTNYDTNKVSINYYKDSSYTNKVTSVKDVLEYYTKVDVDLDNYNCSNTSNIIFDIYEPISITLNNQGATSAGTTNIYQWYKHGIYLDNALTKKMTSSANKITNPSRTGYTFSGYYNQTSGGTQLINNSGNITSSFTNTYFSKYEKNATIYARWTPNKYTVNLNANGGSVSPTSATVTYDSTYGTLPTPTRTGYTFAGWYTATSGGSKIASNTKVTITATQTLYARWTANKYTVNLNANGGSVSPTSTTVTYNSTYGTLPTPSRTGYTFAGWYTATSGGSKIVSSTKVTITTTQTLYARWTANKYTITFNATANGGSVSTASKSVTYDSTYGTLPTASRWGSTFNGWYTQASGGTKITESTTVKITKNTTLYAQYTVNIKVGDYVTYTPPSASYTVSSSYSGRSNQTLSNTSSSYKITSWRVYSISGNTVELISAAPTTGTLKLYGAQGFNNGVKLLNDACNTLYKNSSKGITGRSIKLEDITKVMNSTGLNKVNNYNEDEVKPGVRMSKAYTKSSRRYYPLVYIKEKNNTIDGNWVKTGWDQSEQTAFINATDNGGTNGRKKASKSIQMVQTYWWYYASKLKSSFQGSGTGTSNVYYSMIFNTTSTNYWIATRTFATGSSGGSWQIAYVMTGGYPVYIGGAELYDSTNEYLSRATYLRPIITLNKSTISVEYSKFVIK